MQLSELIQQLQSIYETQGDLPVVDFDCFNVRSVVCAEAQILFNPIFCLDCDIPLEQVFVRINTDR